MSLSHRYAFVAGCLLAAALPAGPAAGQEWTESTDLYAARAMTGEEIPMAGYYVRVADGWPELMKVSDRHTQWGHQRIPPGSFGRIMPGRGDLEPAPAGERRGAFERIVGMRLPGGGTCAFTFGRFSPATRIETDADALTLFAAEKGVPRFLAYPGEGGRIEIVPAGRSVPGEAMTASWLLVWRGEDPAYENSFVPSFLHCAPNPFDREDFDAYVKPRPADAPWLVVLQRRPRSVTLGERGLRLEFPGAAGETQVLPIGGFRWYRGSDTQAWAQGGLPEDVAQACRDWNAYLKQVPVSMEEAYRVAGGDVLVRTTFRFRAIEDDWGTAGAKLAPLPPVTALALKAGLENLSLEGDPALADPGYPTLTGAWLGVWGQDGYTLRFAGVTAYADEPAGPAGGAALDPQARDRLVRKLETHLREMLDAGHLAPYESQQGTLQYSFWGNPGELVEVLLAVRPYVSADVQQGIDDYLRAETGQFGLLEVGWCDPRDGARRESHPVDLELADPVARRRKGPEPAHIENLPGLLAYGEHFDDWGWMDTRWDEARSLVHQEDARLDWQIGWFDGGVADLNRRIAGLIAYAGLAQRKGDAAARAEALALLAQALTHRFAFAKLSEYAFASGQYHVPESFDLPRFHARNAHKFNVFLPAYRLGASYRTAPQVGHVSRNDRYLSEIGNFWHDHSIWAFTHLTPGLARFLRETVPSELENYWACVEEGLPTWYVTRAENLHAIGEDAYFSPYMNGPLFQARALIFRDGAPALARWIDLPAAKGDLNYLRNIATVLAAEPRE